MLGIDTTHAYWSIGKTLSRASKLGGAAAEAIYASPDPNMNQTLVRALTTDATHVYWVQEDGVYRRVKDASSPVEPLCAPGVVGLSKLYVSGLGLTAIAVDDTSVFVALQLEGNILRVGTSGAGCTLLLDGGAKPKEKGPIGVVVDSASLFVATEGSYAADYKNGAIVRMKKDGSERQELAASLPGPVTLALSGDDVVWVNRGFLDNNANRKNGGVALVSKTGGATVDLVTGYNQDVLRGVAADATSVFVAYTPASGAALWQLGKAPGAPAIKASAKLPHAVAVDGATVYYTANTGTFEYQVLRVDK